jgi:squalene-hopene/tetraprenyl-beta-curcumene cyclase
MPITETASNARTDHADFGSNEAKAVNETSEMADVLRNGIDSDNLERDAGGKPVPAVTDPASGAIDHTLRAAVDWMFTHQQSEGYWVGMIETNSSIEAEWLLASHILGVQLPHEDGVVRALVQRQRPDGSWGIYPGAPDGDINSTVEVYAALRAKGFDPKGPELTRARAFIHTHGGLGNLRVFTRYWLAMLGVWPWEATPNLPPEIIRLPLWFPFNIYNFASWARATIVPLTVVSARRPVWPLPPGPFGSKLEELFPDGYDNFDFFVPLKVGARFSPEWIFSKIDRILHAAQSTRLIPGRETAIKLCLEWLLKHQDSDGGWGGIQPPWIYGIIALRNEGYATEHPVLAKAWDALSAHWSYERNGAIHLQASESPVWDTLLSLLALHEAGVEVQEQPKMQAALDWVLQRQVLTPGDWAIKVKNVAPGGWAFERANTLYPDVDDTAVAMLVLGKIRGALEGPLRQRIDVAIDRALAWTFAMQSHSGGWAAFDKDNDKEIICKIPFCNFGEALDPPSVDVTGHVLEALGSLGLRADHPVVARALTFIRQEQEADGSWFGRWGVNYIYGTGAVLPGLRAIGVDMRQPYIVQAADWIAAKQNQDGGWGETCASYMDPALRGVGASTPSQTAWALLALLALESPAYAGAVRKGLDYLVATQDAHGTWDEQFYTGTGFPGYGIGGRADLDAAGLREKLGQGTELSRGFMLGYNLYRHYFPILALGRAKEWLESGAE